MLSTLAHVYERALGAGDEWPLRALRDEALFDAADELLLLLLGELDALFDAL